MRPIAPSSTNKAPPTASGRVAGVLELVGPGDTCCGADDGTELELLAASTSIIFGGAGAPSRDRDATVGDLLALEGSWSEPATVRPRIATERSA